MANITGTSSQDVLRGFLTDDLLMGLDGDDVLIGSGGNDILNGGGGNDQIFGDANIAFSGPIFSYNNKFYTLSNAGSWTQAQAQAVSLGGNLVAVNDAAENQFLVNTFGGAESLWIGLTDAVTEGAFKWANGEALTYTNWYPGEPNNAGNEDYVEFNFGSPGKWNDRPDFGKLQRGIIEIGSSNDTITGSTGNDTINGGIGQDTADYSDIGQAITLRPTGVLSKGTAGTDQLISVEQIVGARGRANVIDASTATGIATINANLEAKSLVVNTGVSAFPTLNFGVTNFATVIGTVNNDTIAGDNGNNSLVGGSGNDNLNGGGGNDTIFGDLTSSITTPVFSYNNKFYTLSNAGSWTQAQAQAVRLGGNLVTVNDAAENQFLVNTFGGAESLWIGLTDEVTEGAFKWANGEALTYTNWYPGEPNNAGNEDYVEFNFGSPGKWNDRPDFGKLQRGIIEIGSSNDTITGSTGNDTINGGIGQDTADYSDIGQAITLRPTGVLSKGTAGTDQLISVEQIVGARGRANVIDASTATGIATINANLEAKSLVVNTGVSAFPTLNFGVTNFATVIGTVNNDTIAGDNGNNSLVGGSGNDNLNGGGGNDTIFGDLTSSITTPVFSYNNKFYTLSNAGSWTQAQAQAVRLGGNLVTVNDAAENQFLVNTFGGAESLWIGLTDEVTEGAFKWANGEALTYTNWYPGEPNNAGNEDYAEFNFGSAGRWNDRPDVGKSQRGIIEIGSSADTLVGGLGSDTLTGGLGNDIFRYTSAAESAAGVANRDTITDFQLGLDKLDLSAIDANPFLSMDQAFRFLGSSATFTTSGQLRYQVSGANLFLYGNIDSNLATSELEIQLTGLASLSASNIIL
jgi:Ca2+-binding RTX toxin-like protein